MLLAPLQPCRASTCLLSINLILVADDLDIPCCISAKISQLILTDALMGACIIIRGPG